MSILMVEAVVARRRLRELWKGTHAVEREDPPGGALVPTQAGWETGAPMPAATRSHHRNHMELHWADLVG